MCPLLIALVEKVDELFSRADKIESKLKKADEEIVHLSKSALHRLLESKDSEEFKKNFQFIIENFHLLYSDERNVKELRQAILQLAVQGKLVPQDLNHEPASDLLKKIKAEKEKLIKEGKLKREKPLPPISEDEIPYELPAGWKWVRISEIYYDLGQKKPENDFTYIDVSSIYKDFGKISDNLPVIKPVNAPSRARKIVDEGTVIYSTVRPYLLNIAIIDRDLEPPLIISTAFAVMHPYQGILNKYLYFYLKSGTFTNFVESKMVGMAYPAINYTQLKNCLFPLPPINEQKRIVQKVDQLMKLCDELESKIIKSKEQSKRLIDAILQSTV